MIRFGIAYTDNGEPPLEGKIIGWKENEKGEDQTFESRDAALEACDLDGWRGYVCEYRPLCGCPRVYPLRDWVVRGAAVRCSIEFTLDFPIGLGSTLTICNGATGRVLTVDDGNVRVYLSPLNDSIPTWQGEGDPVEPYTFVDYMRGDFDGIWESDPPQRPCSVCGFDKRNDRHWNGRVHETLFHEFVPPPTSRRE
jgi:hypothetical protein